MKNLDEYTIEEQEELHRWPLGWLKRLRNSRHSYTACPGLD